MKLPPLFVLPPFLKKKKEEEEKRLNVQALEKNPRGRLLREEKPSKHIIKTPRKMKSWTEKAPVFSEREGFTLKEESESSQLEGLKEEGWVGIEKEKDRKREPKKKKRGVYFRSKRKRGRGVFDLARKSKMAVVFYASAVLLLWIFFYLVIFFYCFMYTIFYTLV